MTDMVRLLAEHYEYVRWFAWHVWPDKSDDLSQEACLAILNTKSPPRQNVKAWIKLKVLGARRSLMRRDKQYKLVGIDLDTGLATTPDQENCAELTLVRGRLGGLTDGQRTVVSMVLDGSNLNEAAAAMGITQQRASQHMKLARQNLQLAA